MAADDPESQIDLTARRPIAARGAAWAGWMAASLGSRGVTPNAVSVTSVLMAGAGGVAIGVTAVTGNIVAAVLLVLGVLAIVLRSLCNLLDGMIAVEGGRATASGPIFNDLPDRVSDVVLFVGAGYAASVSFQWGATLGWVAAVAALLTAYVRVLGATLGLSHDFRGPMAKPHRMAVLGVACAGAAVERLMVGSAFAVSAGLVLVFVGCVLTTALRLSAAVRVLEHRDDP
ncbi:MAG: CDP-alcohol phosphatidyltransferase family protein [Planctomycetota bacterium]